MPDFSNSVETLTSTCVSICGSDRINHFRLLMVEGIVGIRSNSLAAQIVTDGYLVDTVKLAQWFIDRPTRPPGIGAEVETACLNYIDRHSRRMKHCKPKSAPPGKSENPLKAIARSQWQQDQTVTAKELFSILCNRSDTMTDDQDGQPIKVGTSDSRPVTETTFRRWLTSFRSE